MEIEKVHLDPSLCQENVLGNKTFRSTCDFRVTEADLSKARKELRETEHVRKNALKELKILLSNDKHIKYRTDNDYLIRFLRFRKFDVKKSYKFLKGFYTMRKNDPPLFTMPTDVEVKMKGKFSNIMPYTNEDGVLVFLHRFGDWNPSEISVRDLLNMFSYVSDVVTMNPHAQIDGVLDIWDFQNITMEHYLAIMNPLTVRLWTKFVQDVYPWRIKKVILLNCGTLVYTGLSVIRYFLKKKLAQRLVLIRSDLDELHKHVDPAILPKEYGGFLPDDDSYSYLKKLILSNKKYIQYENKFIG